MRENHPRPFGLPPKSRHAAPTRCPSASEAGAGGAAFAGSRTHAFATPCRRRSLLVAHLVVLNLAPRA